MEQSLPQLFSIQSTDVILLSAQVSSSLAGTHLERCRQVEHSLVTTSHQMLCPIACLGFPYMSQPILTPSFFRPSFRAELPFPA